MESRMENRQLFQEFGLSYYESKALTKILERPITAKELSRQAKIPLGKIYSIIKSLKEKGLIDFSNERPKKFYYNSFTGMRKLIDKKEKNFQNLLNKIREIATKYEKRQFRDLEKGFFNIGLTNEDNRILQLRVFQEAKQEVCQIHNNYYNPKTNRKNKTLWEKEVLNALERGVKFRSIFPKKAAFAYLTKKAQKEYPKNFLVKRLDTDFIRCDIIDKKVILIKFVDEDVLRFLGLIRLEDERLAENFLVKFEELWNIAE